MNICVISGSTLGSAEYVAEHLEEVLKTQGFSTALFHLLGSFDLDMYSRQSHKIWNITEGHRAAALYGIPIFAENSGKFPFTVRAFAL